MLVLCFLWLLGLTVATVVMWFTTTDYERKLNDSEARILEALNARSEPR